MKLGVDIRNNEFGGYIDVKIPSKGRKLGPWKTWKKQWCVLKRPETNKSALEMLLGNNGRIFNNSIIVPSLATLCRSESRTRPFSFGIFLSENESVRPIIYLSGKSETESQSWMAHIRHFLHQNITETTNILPPEGEGIFTVSLIDNTFSRSIGICGIYGKMELNESELVIRNPNNRGTITSWKWSQIENYYLQSPAQNEEDSGKIFVFHLRHEDNCEVGKMNFFCSNAIQLESAVSKYRLGRQRRLLTSPLPPTPTARGMRSQYYHSMRRMSKSEGDLRLPMDLLEPLLNIRSRSTSREKNLKEPPVNERNIFGKVAKNLIMTSTNLLISTPGSSYPDSLNEYQPLPDCVSDNISPNVIYNNSIERSIDINTTCSDSGFYQPVDEAEETDHFYDFMQTPLKTISTDAANLDSRRDSGVSVASGIYAEIDENQKNGFINTTNNMLLEPPPLPPRMSNEQLNLIECDKPDLIFNSKQNNCRLYKNIGIENQLTFDKTIEPDYLPMSPVAMATSNNDLCNEETYVSMSSIFNKTTPLTENC